MILVRKTEILEEYNRTQTAETDAVSWEITKALAAESGGLRIIPAENGYYEAATIINDHGATVYTRYICTEELTIEPAE